MLRALFLPAAAGMVLCSAPLFSQSTTSGAKEVDYSGFQALTKEVADIRSERLLTFEQFSARSARPGSLVLDTRSAAAFEAGHIKGAVNLSFSDFTTDKLEAVIGTDKRRMVLIYCNNNFSDNVPPVRSKMAALALNIPTFINWVGYGYSNVWELGDTVAIADVDWVRTPEMAQKTS